MTDICKNRGPTACAAWDMTHKGGALHQRSACDCPHPILKLDICIRIVADGNGTAMVEQSVT